MPLSNYVPSSAVSRPGVCTSTTRPTNPFEGQTIYETDTDTIRVWTGSEWIGISSALHLRINSSGHINTPLQPILSGQIGTAATNPTGDSLIPFNEFWVDQGGILYNSTTRRFTVPTAGAYRVTFNPFFNTGSGAARVLIGKNTDTPTPASNFGHAYRESATFDTASIDSIIPMSSGDYIVFRLQSGSLYNQSTDRFNQFSIQLIG